MEEIEWMRLIAPLLPVINLSAMSKLPSASSMPISTPSGLTFNPLKNRFTEKSEKSLFVHALVKQNFIHNRLGQTYFFDFSAEPFSIHEDEALKG